MKNRSEDARGLLKKECLSQNMGNGGRVLGQSELQKQDPRDA